MKPARSQLLIVLLAVSVVPAAVAGWLGWRLLIQDQIIAGELLREVRERRADDVVQSMSHSLAALMQQTRNLPSGTVKALGAPLAYDADPRPLPEASAVVFSAAETAEFRPGPLGEVVDIYRKLATSTQPPIRAGALLRLGRALRKIGRKEDAAEVYRQLVGIEDAAAGGAPAALAGQWAICTIAAEKGGEGGERIKREGEKLRALLDSGRFSLGRDTYEIYADDAARWSGKARPVVSEALADAAASHPSGCGAGAFRGQQITWLEDQDRILLLAPDYVQRLLPAGAVQVHFATQPEKYESLRRSADTGLPWTIAVSLADPAKEQQAFVNRRGLLVGLLAFVAVVGIGGGYLGWRVIRRELALAQMQADLVAAVSHEFRTPLTSMRQVSDALCERRVQDEERKQAYYQALGRATDRLHRLVEGLLDFGKMESGAMPYRMESIDLAAMTAGVTGEFQKEAQEKGFAIHLGIPPREVPMKGDAEALGRALWNLLDNAVKYSGESREVWIKLSINGNQAEISVTDKGIGIPPKEQQEVFRKFFRGAASRESRIRGTGIGLAMVEHIVHAHGGRVTLESQPGAGSTFAMHLPLED